MEPLNQVLSQARAAGGIHHMVHSPHLPGTGRVTFGLVAIGLIGLVADVLVRLANRWLFPWASR